MQKGPLEEMKLVCFLRKHSPLLTTSFGVPMLELDILQGWIDDRSIRYHVGAGADKQSRLMLAAEMETKGNPAALERLTEVNDRLLRSG